MATYQVVEYDCRTAQANMLVVASRAAAGAVSRRTSEIGEASDSGRRTTLLSLIVQPRQHRVDFELPD
jgi:hypothetical protein